MTAVPGTFVYFVQAGDGGPIKIGMTHEPVKRLASLQTSNHEELRILRVCPCDHSAEAALHARFAEDRIRGE